MLSRIDLINWKLNQNINPTTGRKIKKTGAIFKRLSVAYHKIFKLDIFKIADHVDLISQERFIIIDKNGNRKWVYKDIDNIIFYQEKNLVRAFTKISLHFLKKKNINLHPVSKEIIPEFIFNGINVKISEDNIINVENEAKMFFQKLSNHSIFIDYTEFLELELGHLHKLEYELKEFYYQNLPTNIRINIDNYDGNLLFKDKPTDKEELIKYLIKNMNTILDNISDAMKVFSYYIIVGALSLVIPNVKKNYPNYSFSF
jgi:hypothetical protein